MDELLADVAAFGETPTILVACAFDGALAYEGDDRALQQSSEALNVLQALPGTVVAVVSREPVDRMSELMFLSGAKGGLRMIAPEDLEPLRADLGAAALVVDTDPRSLAGLGAGDLGVLVDAGADPDAAPEGRVFRVVDPDDVVVVLEELVGVRWRRLLVTGHATASVPVRPPAPPAPPRGPRGGR